MKSPFSFTVILAFFLASCNELPISQPLDDSLDTVDSVFIITGADSVDVRLNKGNRSMFEIEISNMDSIYPWVATMYDGWCIDWQKPINSNNGFYSGLRMYSTQNVESWKPINFLANQLNYLFEEDLDLTYREIQLAIWSLRGNPVFKLSEVALEDLPGRFRDGNQPLFSYEKVEAILSFVNQNYETYQYSENDQFAVIIETPADLQTIIAIVGN